MTGLRSLAGLCLPLLLAACATQPPPANVDAAAPARWNAPLPAAGDADLLPHQGTQGGLSAWWRQRGDPVLVELIESAQAVSPTVAAAGSRIDGNRQSPQPGVRRQRRRRQRSQDGDNQAGGRNSHGARYHRYPAVACGAGAS